MATYKVIQDIEAEDKFLGPLTLKQFVFGAGGVVFGYLGFFSVVQGIPFLLIFFVPLAILGFFLAIPWSKDQPTEVWVLAKIRFRFKPRVRIWSQDGIQELVTITVPKVIDRHLTKNFTETEVRSRLKALADTIDSRGWAVKNMPVNAPITPGEASSQRLLSISTLPQQVSDLASNDMDDPLDEQNSAVAAKFDHMIKGSSASLKSEALSRMDEARSIKNDNSKEKLATQAAEDKLLSEQLRQSSTKKSAAVSNLHTIPTKPTDKETLEKKAQASIPATPSTGILNLSQNNDLDVATIARQANKDEPPEEVVISLH